MPERRMYSWMDFCTVFSYPEKACTTYHFFSAMCATLSTYVQDQVVDRPKGDGVEQPDVYTDDEHHHDDHQRRLGRFPARRPDDLPHLVPCATGKGNEGATGLGRQHDARRRRQGDDDAARAQQ